MGFNRLFLLLVLGFSLPVGLRGQVADSTSSIVGQVFWRLAGSMLPREKVDVLLITDDGETRHAITDNTGKFTFSDITSKQVRLLIPEEWDIHGTAPNYAEVSTDTFELMPGENIVMAPVRNIYPSSTISRYEDRSPLVIVKKSIWTFYIPGDVLSDFAIELLKQLPGVVYSKGRGTIAIPEETVHCTESNGVYIFGVKP